MSIRARHLVNSRDGARPHASDDRCTSLLVHNSHFAIRHPFRLAFLFARSPSLCLLPLSGRGSVPIRTGRSATAYVADLARARPRPRLVAAILSSLVPDHGVPLAMSRCRNRAPDALSGAPGAASLHIRAPRTLGGRFSGAREGEDERALARRGHLGSRRDHAP
mgnify:CR=1 FL=1